MMRSGMELMWYAEQAPIRLERVSGGAELLNPQCGDRCVVEVLVEGRVVKEISLSVTGCAMCRAVAGWLQEKVKNLPVNEVLAWDPLYAVTSWDLTLGPLRQKCAKLPVETLIQALHVSFQPKKWDFETRGSDPEDGA